MLQKILSNTLAQLVAKFIGVTLTFLTTILIMRLGGAELFGDLTKALALIAIGFTAIDFGLNAVAVRAMQGSASSQRQTLADTLLSRAALSFVAIFLVNLAVYFLPGGYTPEIKAVFYLGSLSIFFQGIYTSLNAWFQRRLAYWKMSFSTVLGTAVGTLFTYLAVISSPTLFKLLAATTLGYAVMATTSLLLAPRLSPRQLLLSFSRLKPTLLRSLPLGAILVFSILASKLDSVILGVYRSSAEVGQYGFAYRIFDVILVLPVFVMNSVYPLLLGQELEAKKRLVKNSSLTLFFASLLGVIIVWFVAPFLALIRPDLTLAITVLRVLAFSLPLFYLTSPLMWQLIEAKLEKYLLFIYGAAAIFNGLTNLFFIPRFGALASALLTITTETLILLGLLFVRKRFYDQP